MKLFSLLFCGRTQQPTQQYKPRLQSNNSIRLSQSLLLFDGSFKQKVRQYQKTHVDQVKKFKKKQQLCHVVKDIDHMKQNIKKSLRVMDNKGYLKHICFSLWPKHMIDRLSAIQNSGSNDWRKELMKQIDDLEAVFGFYIESIYKNINQSPYFYANLSISFKDALDRITASQKWIPLNFRIQNFFCLSKYRIQNGMVEPKVEINQQFKYLIQLLKKVYTQPHLFRKNQYIAELQPVVHAYSRPKLIFSVCEYCIYKTKLPGFHQMLQFLELLHPPQSNIKDFFKLLKASSIRSVLNFQKENPFQYQYITFDLSQTSVFILTNLSYITTDENHWNSLISLTILKPSMSINLKLNFKYNHFKIGVIGQMNQKDQLRDYSEIENSVCLCLMSGTIIKNGEKIKINRIPQAIKQIQMNIFQNQIEWRYQKYKLSTQIDIQGPLRLHLVMKRGTFQQMPLQKIIQ